MARNCMRPPAGEARAEMALPRMGETPSGSWGALVETTIATVRPGKVDGRQADVR